MSKFDKLLELKGSSVLVFTGDSYRLALCPDLGARVYAEIDGICPHRMDLPTIANPTEDFNNYGGANFWPAPEGGIFGFNYDGDTWRVQSAINTQPFEVISQDSGKAVMAKTATFINKSGTAFQATMRRSFRICDPDPDIKQIGSIAAVAFDTVDEFDVKDKVEVSKALIGSWTLEQFDTSDTTEAFCFVENPQDAINFDFYEHPGERIKYHPKGFTYKTDGKKAGQIGIKVAAKPGKIGFTDSANNILCIRENLSGDAGVFFNIADNDQPEGPYSASDCYSIFNSDPEMSAFELETIGSAKILGNILLGSRLVSRTSIAVIKDFSTIKQYLAQNLD